MSIDMNMVHINCNTCKLSFYVEHIDVGLDIKWADFCCFCGAEFGDGEEEEEGMSNEGAD